MKFSKRTAILLTLAVLLATGIGGYYLWHSHFHGKSVDGSEQSRAPVQYTCPMHPFIIRDRAGSCPICGMDLVPVQKTETGEVKEGEPGIPGHVSLSPSQMVMANVATVTVERETMSREVSASGIVQYDQSRQARVTAWTAGRIDRLYVDTVGAHISRGKPVAEVYSPDLVSAQQEYLLALKSRDQLKNSSIPSISRGGEGLVSSARQRLKLLGVKDYQIAALEKSGQPSIRLPIYTPLSGIVIEKIALQGQYVNVGDPLFTIADLSSVWVEAEVYESDFPSIRIGQKAEVISQSYPGRAFHGAVSFIYPFLDQKTRTVKVRVQLPNPGLRLKPDMFVRVSLKIPLGDALVVPVTAVMDSGKRKVVWVETKQGMFSPRDVQVGARAGDKVQILSGLSRGDRVAASGGYLIDSEAQLKGGGSAAHAVHEGHAPPSVQTEKGDDMDMSDMKME